MVLKDFLKSIHWAGFAGLLAGISTGALIAVTLLVCSFSFMMQTGRALIIFAYVIAYTTLLLWFLFTIMQSAVYFIGKLLFVKKKKLFQSLTALIPASFPGVVFFLNGAMFLLFYIYNGIFNSKVIILVMVSLVVSFVISFILWPTVKRLLEYLVRHSLAVFIIFFLCLLTVIFFHISTPSVPYPGYKSMIKKEPGNVNLKNKKDNPVDKPETQTALPNVILVTIETTRADHIGAYGYGRNISPNIDKFAGENVRFSKCYLQSPATVVNLSSLLTSAYPGETGVFAQTQVLPGKFVTITEILKGKGYHTIGITSNFLLPEVKGVGVAQGFDEYINFKHSPASAVTSCAKSKLEQVTDPFFLWLHFFDPHVPYNPPMEFFKKISEMPKAKDAHDLFPLVDYGSRTGVNLKRTFGDNYRPSKGSKKIKKGYIYDLYDSEILYVDSEIGKFLSYLESKGQFENSLIIITSDHGESLVEHNLYCQHCLDLYRGNTEVPLLIHFPGYEKKNIEVSTPVSTIDIFPTILKALGISGTGNIRGISLFQFLPEAAYPKERDHVIMTGWWDGISLKLRNLPDQNPDFAIVSNRYKYVVHSIEACNVVYPLELIHLWREALTNNLKADEMYDLIKDPLETINIKKNNVKTAQLLKRKLFTSREFFSYIHGKRKKKKITKEQTKRLKSLGYL